MIRRYLILGVLAALVLAAQIVVPQTAAYMTPSASAASCPAVEVVFARGRLESPGVGVLGNAFINALRSKSNKNIGVYAVKYPADNEIDVGANDMSGHIQYMAGNCPNTRLVLGGYSLGAGVTNRVLNDPLPQGVDDRIVAVALFGNASRLLDVPLAPGPEFDGKSIDVCNPGDPICSGGPFALSHLQLAYVAGGGVNSAVEFAMSKL